MSQKTKQNCFRLNFVKFPPALIMFGQKMDKTIKLCEVTEVHSLSISANLCQCTIPSGVAKNFNWERPRLPFPYFSFSISSFPSLFLLFSLLGSLSLLFLFPSPFLEVGPSKIQLRRLGGTLQRSLKSNWVHFSFKK